MIDVTFSESREGKDRYSLSPYFSIIMPCYNSGFYIEESIDSVLKQTEQDFELIVVDDGSTDDSVMKVRRAIAKDSRVRLVENKGRRGASGARNYGVSLSAGKWLCFLDSDDLYEPAALEQRRLASSMIPDCEFFSSDFFLWEPETGGAPERQSLTNDFWHRYFGKAHPGGIHVLKEDLMPVFIQAPLAWTGGVTMRRSLFIRLDGFDESLVRAEDDHLWIRSAAAAGAVGLINRPDVRYRLRNSGLSQGTGSRTPYSSLMIRKLLREPLLRGHKKAIRLKLEKETYLLSLYYRGIGQRRLAMRFAMESFLASRCKYSKARNLVGSIIMKP